MPQQQECFPLFLAISNRHLNMLIYLWELNQPEPNEDFFEQEIGLKDSKCYKWTHHHLIELLDCLCKYAYCEAIESIMRSLITSSIYESLTCPEKLRITKRMLISKRYPPAVKEVLLKEFSSKPYATISLTLLL